MRTVAILECRKMVSTDVKDDATVKEIMKIVEKACSVDIATPVFLLERNGDIDECYVSWIDIYIKADKSVIGTFVCEEIIGTDMLLYHSCSFEGEGKVWFKSKSDIVKFIAENKGESSDFPVQIFSNDKTLFPALGSVQTNIKKSCKYEIHIDKDGVLVCEK